MKKNYKKETYKTREEWLKARGIGGSDASAIVDKSKWLTKNDIYNRLVCGKEKNIKCNERMQEGIKTESIMRNLFMVLKPNFKVIEPPKRKGGWIYRRIDFPLITCTPDGIVVNTENNKRYGYEGKNVQLFKREDKENWESGILPDQYYFQVLHYLVTMNDLDGVIVHPLLTYMRYEDGKYVYDHSEIREYWIYREEVLDHIKYLEDKEIEFIENNVKKQKRPETKIII